MGGNGTRTFGKKKVFEKKTGTEVKQRLINS
jgi:hypothetical protein